ncbi:MAG: phage tail tape measure protein [Oscillospiraceae bacterium]|jgi:hypothetical protein|nr:phage tail tape measure protein [Oscillospiraceae bacterium]
MEDLKISVLTELELEKNALLNLQKEANKYGIKLNVSIDDSALNEKIKETVKSVGATTKVNLGVDSSQINKESERLSKSLERAKNEQRQLLIMYERLLKTNTKIQTDGAFNGKVQGAYQQLKVFNTTDPAKFSQEMVNARGHYRDLVLEMNKSGLSGKTFLSEISDEAKKLGVYLSGSAIVMGAKRQIDKMINTVISLDGVLTDLQIATGNTRAETKELLNTYSELGKQLGATTVEVGKSADDWLRQGLSISDTNKLIKDSMMLSKLGQIDATESTKALTSAMKGYGVGVDDVSGIVDKLTAVDMEAATSAGYLATAMAETATGAKLSGIGMDRLIGYIANVAEITQDGAESVGKCNCRVA